MKIKIPAEKLVEIKQFVSTLSDTIEQHQQLLLSRQQLSDLAVRTGAEMREKHGTYDLTDDKEVLAHLIRVERWKSAGERHNWNERLALREENKFDDLQAQAFDLITGLMNSLIDSTHSQIAEKLAPTVGADEANRLAGLAEPVTQLRKLLESRFVDHSEAGFNFRALLKMREVFNHILSEDASYEALMKRLAVFKKKPKAAAA